MKPDLWELLFRANSLMRVLVKSDLSGAAELAEVARELDEIANLEMGVRTAHAATDPQQD